jgi:acyl carrier protein
MDTRTKLIADIKKFFANSDEYPGIGPDTDLFREIGLNSIQLVSFIAYLEHLRKEKIHIAQIDQESIRTIDAIIQNYFRKEID